MDVSLNIFFINLPTKQLSQSSYTGADAKFCVYVYVHFVRKMSRVHNRSRPAYEFFLYGKPQAVLFIAHFLYHLFLYTKLSFIAYAFLTAYFLYGKLPDNLSHKFFSAELFCTHFLRWKATHCFIAHVLHKFFLG